MTEVFVLLVFQVALGAFDNLWHHEIVERLPAHPAARREVALHAVRELIYAAVFLAIAWAHWHGAWTWALAALLAVEIAVTVADFVVEDRTRRLPRLERILHTVLALNYGAILALWAPVLAGWAAQPTGVVAADHGLWRLAFTAFAFGVFAWAVRDAIAAARLGVPGWQRDPIRAGDATDPRTVLVTGATGFVGRHLVRALVGRGHRVIALSRDPAMAAWRFGPKVEAIGDLDRIDSSRRIDAIVNLAGAPVAGLPWTEGRKRRLLASRLRVTRQVVRLASRLNRAPAVLVTGSAIGFYGDRGDETVDETAGPQTEFMSELCRRWENTAAQAQAAGTRVSWLRIGLVLGVDGGVLPGLARPVRLGLGARFGDGAQWMSWIHVADLINLILRAIDDPTFAGPVNAVAPQPVTHDDFMAALARRLGRRIRIAVSARLLRTAMGEMSGLLLASQRVLPGVATAAGFQFRFADLHAALADLMPHDADEPVTALMNEACPICSAVLHGYGARCGAALTVQPIGAMPDVLAACGLTADDLRRRLYTITPSGSVRSGVEAFDAVWRAMPGHRWCVRLLSLPGIHALADAAYEGVAVPALAAWNARRARRRPLRRGVA